MNVVTNCSDTGPSLPIPKQVRSACPSVGVPNFSLFSDARVDPATGAFPVHIWHHGGVSDGLSYDGYGKADTTGTFQRKLVLTNGSFFIPLLNVNRVAAIQSRDFGTGPVAQMRNNADSSGVPAPPLEPGDKAASAERARSAGNLADRVAGEGRRDEALASAEEAVEIYRALVTRNPDTYRSDLAGSLNNLARFYAELSREALANSLWREVMRLREPAIEQLLPLPGAGRAA